MIQDIQPHIYHNEYKPRQPVEGDIVFVFRGEQILMRCDGERVAFPAVREVGQQQLQYLFSVDEIAFFLGSEPVEGYEFQQMRALRMGKPQHHCFAGMTAWHLHTWYGREHFCGKCGKPMQHHKTLRAMECPECSNLVFPMIAPAVIVAVTKGDEILLTRYAGRAYKGYALIAGFCEIGERAEDTVHREVMEEAGVKVKNLRYFGSQPWGFASNLLLGFFCELDGDDHIVMDTEELQFAQWVHRDDLQEQTNLASMTATMIELFRRNEHKNSILEH